MEARRKDWLDAIEQATDEVGLKAVEARLFGKKGEITTLVKSVSSLPKAERPAAGKAANQLKVELARALATRAETLQTAARTGALEAPEFDPTEPGPAVPRGTLHPITVVQNELVDLFSSMGFSWQDGPEIESDWFNFEALNHPPDHPARDLQDTFYVDDGNLLRTHTSPPGAFTGLLAWPSGSPLIAARMSRVRSE